MLNEGTIQKIVGKHKWSIAAVVSRGAVVLTQFLLWEKYNFYIIPFPLQGLGMKKKGRVLAMAPRLGRVRQRF